MDMNFREINLLVIWGYSKLVIMRQKMSLMVLNPLSEKTGIGFLVKKIQMSQQQDLKERKEIRVNKEIQECQAQLTILWLSITLMEVNQHLEILRFLQQNKVRY